MALVARTSVREGDRALVGIHHLHRCRLADDHGSAASGKWSRMWATSGTHALAAHLLVTGEREMNGRLQFRRLELRHHGSGTRR
jgi:hypothetical protein